MPDGGISPVRLKSWLSSVGLSLFVKAQALVRIHRVSVVCPQPRFEDNVRRLHRFIKPATDADVKTAQYPESLCPQSLLPPMGRRGPLLRGHYPSVPWRLGNLEFVPPSTTAYNASDDWAVAIEEHADIRPLRHWNYRTTSSTKSEPRWIVTAGSKQRWSRHHRRCRKIDVKAKGLSRDLNSRSKR